LPHKIKQNEESIYLEKVVKRKELILNFSGLKTPGIVLTVKISLLQWMKLTKQQQNTSLKNW